MTRVLYVSPMRYEANAAVDAISHGLQARLAGNDAELRVAYADFDEPDWHEQADRHVRAGADAGYDAIVIWVIEPDGAARGWPPRRGRDGLAERHAGRG